MNTLNKTAEKFFFTGFREQFLRQNAGASDAEVDAAFTRFRAHDDLYAIKFRIVKVIVAIWLVLKYFVPGAILAAIALHFGVHKDLFG